MLIVCHMAQQGMIVFIIFQLRIRWQNKSLSLVLLSVIQTPTHTESTLTAARITATCSIDLFAV